VNHVRTFAIATTLLLLLTACGSSQSDSALVDALAEDWTAEEEFPEGVSIDCVAEGFVRGIGGIDGAAEYGITPANIAGTEFDINPLSEADALTATGNMFECDGFEAAILGDLGPTVTDEQAVCLADNIDDEPLAALLATSFMGNNGAAVSAAAQEFESLFQTGFIKALTTCGVQG